MAPNRKQLAVAVDPLVGTEPLVQAKYLPLTALALETNNTAEPLAPTVIRSNVDSHDYWYEPNAVVAVKDLFSADHLVANLIRDDERRRNSTNTITCRASPSNSMNSDDYWAERVQAHNAAAAAAVSSETTTLTTDYWEWPADASIVQIALLLKQQLDSTSTNCYTTATQETKTQPEHDAYWTWNQVTKVVPADGSIQERDAYWEWNTEPKSEKQVKEEIMASIVEDEIVRCLFSAHHIQANLEQEAAAMAAKPAPACVQEAHDAYWCWPAEEDDYWNERPRSLAERAEAMPVQGYWVW